MTTSSTDSSTGTEPTEPTEVTEPTGASARPAQSAGPHGYSSHKADHLKRLRRIEGQARGLQRMVEEDVYCIDILTQVSATTKALQSFALALLDEHIKHCVAAAVEEGGSAMDEKVSEAMTAISRLLRS